ncbi:MAG: Lrp/AsnC family transcriptional regulator, partial [Luminiphilus sp.]
MNLDKQEKSLVRVLQAQGRISNVELAEQIGISESPCYRRVKA